MTRNRIGVLVALVAAALLVVALAGCGGAKTPAATGGATGGAATELSTINIVMKDFAFTPSSATVKMGDTVIFENQDSAPHRVSIDGQDLGQQTQGQKVEWKATRAGTFPFVCTIHPAMTGEITVQ